MIELLRYLKIYEYLIYFILGGFAIWQLRRFILSWEELRAAAFGLEREAAQQRINRAAALLVLLLFLGAAVFGLVSFIYPNMPAANPLPTPTIDLLASPTATISETLAAQPPSGGETPIPGTPAAPAGCLPGEIEILFPERDTTISGIVEIEGSANLPDFGFYKFEVARQGTENWLTIQAGDRPTTDDMLGFWDTTQLEPGNYSLRLLVVDSEGNQSDPCVVDLYVEMEGQ